MNFDSERFSRRSPWAYSSGNNAMPLTSRQCRLGERLAGRLLLATLVAVATSLGLQSPASATPIAYTLSPTVLVRAVIVEFAACLAAIL
jgi:hypothetical protein